MWRTGSSKVKRTGWLECVGAEDLRSAVRGAIEVMTSAPTERGIWGNRPSAVGEKNSIDLTLKCYLYKNSLIIIIEFTKIISQSSF